MSRRTWAEIVLAHQACRTKGHLWGERQWWGDAARERRGTHRCSRCGRIGYPSAGAS